MSAAELPELFGRALELDEPDRRRLLAEVAGRDAHLARELERLLAADADEATPSSLERSPWVRLSRTEEESEVALPERVGPFRVLSELGRGGMGRVYLAEQAGEGFVRRVALKVVAGAAAAPEDERRFGSERRILASLEHPGIARFYDAGRAADGTRYIALEYVEGQDLLTHIRRQGLDLRERVRLFLAVLEAVDFAHRRLVVHRDLKPGNILVGADGRPKLLDFGISKLLDADADDEGLTRTERRAFTPAYASPEQRRGERVTIASDVYSLGVLLYEILAGRRPFAKGRAPAAELAAVSERAPEPPSTAVRRTATAPAADETGETSVIRWRDLAGDLDAIALKALRPDPDGRYPSAAALADDLERFLEGRPVEARRGGRRYRLVKFARRHRLGIAAAAATLVALTAGLGVALVQRARAVEAREQAEAATADLHRLTQSLLFEVYEEVRVLPGALKVGGLVLARATEVLDRLARTAGNDPRLLRDLAAGYQEVAFIFQAHPAIARSFNRPRVAVESMERAIALRQRIAARPDAGFPDRLALATAWAALADTRYSARDAEGARAATDEAMTRLAALEAEPDDPALVRYWLAVAHSQAWRRRPPGSAASQEALRHRAEATRLWAALLTGLPPAALQEPRVASHLLRATGMLMDAGRPADALRASDLGLGALGRQTDTWRTANLRFSLLGLRADALEALGRPQEALEATRQALAARAARPPDPDAALNDAIGDLTTFQHAAVLAAKVGDHAFAAAALDDAERVLAESEARWGKASFASSRIETEIYRGDVETARARAESSGAIRRRHFTAALTAYRSALERAESLGGGGHVHGISAERLDEIRRRAADTEAALRR